MVTPFPKHLFRISLAVTCVLLISPFAVYLQDILGSVLSLISHWLIKGNNTILPSPSVPLAKQTSAPSQYFHPISEVLPWPCSSPPKSRCSWRSQPGCSIPGAAQRHQGEVSSRFPWPVSSALANAAQQELSSPWHGLTADPHQWLLEHNSGVNTSHAFLSSEMFSRRWVNTWKLSSHKGG